MTQDQQIKPLLEDIAEENKRMSESQTYEQGFLAGCQEVWKFPLVLAAPDLLAALQGAVKALETANIAGQSLYASKVTEAARAAIAKAEGK